MQGAHSSAVEHYLDMVGVTGSIPVVPTTAFEALHRPTHPLFNATWVAVGFWFRLTSLT
jgi:hypothetical protein